VADDAINLASVAPDRRRRHHVDRPVETETGGAVLLDMDEAQGRLGTHGQLVLRQHLAAEEAAGDAIAILERRASRAMAETGPADALPH
jgi:hypothetical protein